MSNDSLTQKCQVVASWQLQWRQDSSRIVSIVWHKLDNSHLRISQHFRTFFSPKTRRIRLRRRSKIVVNHIYPYAKGRTAVWDFGCRRGDLLFAFSHFQQRRHLFVYEYMWIGTFSFDCPSNKIWSFFHTCHYFRSSCQMPNVNYKCHRASVRLSVYLCQIITQLQKLLAGGREVYVSGGA